MKYELSKTKIYFRTYFVYNEEFKKNFFINLCKWLINELNPEIKELNLNGQRFFKNITSPKINEISDNDINRIDKITPVIENFSFPFIFRKDCLEIRISARDKNFDQFIESNKAADIIINRFVDENIKSKTLTDYWKKYEINLRGAFDNPLLRDTVRAINYLPYGEYEVEGNINANNKKNTISKKKITPPEKVQDLIKQLNFNENTDTEISFLNYNIKIKQNYNLLIFRNINKNQIGLSLYSDQINWFHDLLTLLYNNKLFEPPLIKINNYKTLPLF